MDGVAKMVLNDFLRGRIPWFVPPPSGDGDEGEKKDGLEGRDEMLGFTHKKRKRELEDNGADLRDAEAGEQEDEDGFEGFDED